MNKSYLACNVAGALVDRNLNEVSRQTGISPPTLRNIARGGSASLSILLTLKNYLLIEPNETAMELRSILLEAVNLYGKEGGPWSVPSDPGGWLSRARMALGVKK